MTTATKSTAAKSSSKSKKAAEPKTEAVVLPVAAPAVEVEGSAPIAEPIAEKTKKVLTPSDKIALKVVSAIRSDRSQFNKAFELSEDGNTATHTFSAKLGSAIVTFGRHEVAGKKTRETIARAFIHVKPEGSEKHLEITGPMAARAWYAMNHAPKGHIKSEPDAEAVAAAEAALGL
jgi:hypothetical protein